MLQAGAERKGRNGANECENWVICIFRLLITVIESSMRKKNPPAM